MHVSPLSLQKQPCIALHTHLVHADMSTGTASTDVELQTWPPHFISPGEGGLSSFKGEGVRLERRLSSSRANFLSSSSKPLALE